MSTLRRMFNRPSSEELNSFFVAAQHVDAGGIKEFLDKYPASVNKTSFSGNTALIFAAESHVNMYKGPDKKGSAWEGSWNSVEHMKEQSEKFRNVVKLLLDGDASINATDKKGSTALDYMNDIKNFSVKSTESIFQEDVDFLIENGATARSKVRSDMSMSKNQATLNSKK